jgi:tripartite-type tricarboxylate transporter receptor subunit TctC
MTDAVQLTFAIASVGQPQVDAGTVRAIAVSTLQPTPRVPNVPTISGAGLSGYEVIGWNGFVAPLGTDAGIIAKLNAAVRRALDDPDVNAKLAGAGYDPAPKYSPEQFAEFIRKDTQKWVDLIDKANIKVK